VATIGRDLAKIAFAAQRHATPKTGDFGSYLVWGRRSRPIPKAFSSEVDTGSREENASTQESTQESRASVLIQSEPKL
jgi:hypothetical protein